jgi:hypothetical protein
VSPAARLKHARHVLAGLLVPTAWLALSGTARADDAGKDAGATTTTTAPATTTTTVAPAPATPAPPTPEAVRQQFAQAVAAWWAAGGVGQGSEDPAPSGPDAGGSGLDLPAPPLVDQPGRPVIGVGDLLPALPSRPSRPVRPTPAGVTPSPPLAPTPDATGGIPVGDGPSSGLPSPQSLGLAFSAVPAPSPTGGWTGPVPGALTSVPVVAGGLDLGALFADGPAGGAGTTGQGENPARGPPAASIGTGNADATGNTTETTINQSTTIVVTPRRTVSLTTATNPTTGATWLSATLPSDAFHGASAARIFGADTAGGDGTVTITTGDALATGNSSTTTINQETTVVVTADNANVVVNQPAGVANVGSANAGTGSNIAIGGSGSGTGSASIATGSAYAVGNQSTTTINQTATVVVTGSSSNVSIDQTADVDNIGTATASTGNNSALGGSGGGSGDATITTGDATAIGNASTTTITQTFTSVVTADHSNVSIDQHADVTNVGTATATTGDNTAVGSSGGTSGSEGTAAVQTGNASAIGNLAGTTVDQSGVSITTGHMAGTSVTQAGIVTNIGSAIASSGGNIAIGVH